MKSLKYYLMALAGIAMLNACSDDDPVPGNPTMDFQAEPSSALFGDSLPFTIKASDADVPLSTLKARLYFSDEVVAGEQIKSDDINFKFFHQQGWGGEYKNDALSTTSDLVFIGDGTNGRDAGNLGLVEGKSLENGVAYRFTVDVTAGVSSAVLTVER